MAGDCFRMEWKSKPTLKIEVVETNDTDKAVQRNHMTLRRGLVTQIWGMLILTCWTKGYMGDLKGHMGDPKEMAREVRGKPGNDR